MKAAIFDLDGVLVDTAKYHFLAWQAIAAQLDFDLTIAQNEQLKGVSRVASLERILAWSGQAISSRQRDQFLNEKNEKYLTLVDAVSPKDALPGVLVFLTELKENKIPIALGSASKNARPILDRLEITPFFDAIVDGNDLSLSKPNPEVFLKGATALGKSPEQCIVFEDSQAGIDAANSAKMTAVAVGSPDILKHAANYVSDFETYPFSRLASLFD